MQPLPDESEFEWIRKTRGVLLRPEEPRLSPIEGPGIFVSDLVPPEFEAYARILHRLDACYDDLDNPLSPSEQKVLGISDCEPIKSFVQNRRAASVGPRIRWLEMAALLKLPYVPEINFEWFCQKMDAWCLRRLTDFTRAWPAGEEGEELSAILMNLYKDQPCFFRLPSHFIYHPRKEPMLYAGSLDKVIDFLKARPRTEFEYWWPVDHKWCVCCDDEVGATIVGGSRNLISYLLESHTMECLEVSPTMRLDREVPISKGPLGERR